MLRLLLRNELSREYYPHAPTRDLATGDCPLLRERSSAAGSLVRAIGPKGAAAPGHRGRDYVRYRSRIPSAGCDRPKDGRTMLLIGPLWAIASVGTPRGHSLHRGSARRVRETSRRMDALPRPFLDAERRTPKATTIP